MMLRPLWLQALVLVAGATTASAGVLIVGTYTGTKTPNGRTVEFRIQDGRAKITGQPGQFIYYDHAKRTAYIVEKEKGRSPIASRSRPSSPKPWRRLISRCRRV